MCFGSKDEKNDDPGPRPAQIPTQQPSYTQDGKMSGKGEQQNQQQQHYSNAGSSSYAPPVGPPPSQQYAPPTGPPPSQQYAAPSGPPPSHITSGDFAPPSGPPPSVSYAPPSGQPPSQSYAPPSGPPPGQQYAPPPGPPPSQQQNNHYAPLPGPPPGTFDYTAPPPGAPPSKPQHDWETAVPDTTLFPPPPAFFSGWDRSPANNSTEQAAEAGEAWVKQYPMTPPLHLDPAARQALQHHNIRLMAPNGFRGTMNMQGPGLWHCSTDRTAPDSCILSYPPLYVVTEHSPLATGGRPFTAYYEVQIRDDSRPEETSLALGFTALPYPNFRLPGWHRGSLAVHGDDGHKYINDRWGGKSFTGPFVRGERLGIGMTFEAVNGRMEVNIFLTRNGKKAGSWNLHEEGDAEQDLPVTGLEGFHDLSCAIGTFDRVNFDVIFDPNQWRFRPN